MKRFIDYYRDTHIFAGLVASLFLNILNWAALSWRIFPLQNQEVILHYNIYFGTDKIGPAWHASYVPLLGIACIAINFLLGLYYWKDYKSISYAFNYFTVLLQILLMISSIFTILANL